MTIIFEVLGYALSVAAMLALIVALLVCAISPILVYLHFKSGGSPSKRLSLKYPFVK